MLQRKLFLPVCSCQHDIIDGFARLNALQARLFLGVF